jgi:RNA polymerase sigma-70 factor (ECF subfamily)
MQTTELSAVSHLASEVGDFEIAFRDHFEPMVRALTVAGGNREVAQDCVQDAFSRAYVRWRRISRYDDPVGWVRHVAINRMRDHYRRETRKRRATERLAARPEEQVPEPATEEGLWVLVARLPDQQRIAASLFYVEQLSVREIAVAMELSEGAVKYHLHAARTTLRREWKQEP